VKPGTETSIPEYRLQRAEMGFEVSVPLSLLSFQYWRQRTKWELRSPSLIPFFSFPFLLIPSHSVVRRGVPKLLLWGNISS